MKLALVRSLDAGDPLTRLGPRAFQPEKFLADPPKPDVEVSPGIWRTADGKLETRFEANEAAKWDKTQKRAITFFDTQLELYGQKLRDLINKELNPAYLYTPMPPKPTEHELWLSRGKKPREMQVGETVKIEDIQDGYIIRPTGQYRYSIEARSMTRLA